MTRIGVLGGTFNPIHIGHLAIAQMAKEKIRLDKVIFVPSNWPPHKRAKGIASAEDRYKMVQLAITGNPYFSISDFEIKKKGKSYTIDTLRYFRGKFSKDTKLFFIIGGDLLPQLNEWRYIDEILKIASFIVVNRPGQIRKIKGVRYHAVSMPGIDISSSYLRQRHIKGSSIKYFVPDQVIDYIKRHKLYK